MCDNDRVLHLLSIALGKKCNLIVGTKPALVKGFGSVKWQTIREYPYLYTIAHS